MTTPLATEWAHRVSRYAIDRLRAARRARDIALQFPDSDAAQWRARYLSRHADAWLQRALDARREAGL